MNEVIRDILLTTAAGSVLTIVLLCIKPLTKKLFSPKWQYYIWLTVLIVMILPVKVSLPAEPIHIIPAENTAVQTEQLTPVQTQQEPAQPAVLKRLPKIPVLRMPGISISIVRLSGFLWLAAAILLSAYKLVKYLAFLLTVKKNSVIERDLENIPKRLTVRKTELLDAPLIAGLIKPVLYLPKTEINEDELNYILLHELTHYRRHDLLYKWFTMLVSSIHWFNPFIYIVSKQIDEECEASCDYEVCKNLTEPQKKDYMAMILNFVQTSIQKRRPLTTQMASSKKILKRRFIIMTTKKATSKFVSVLSAVLALAMLSATAFASGVLSGLTEENHTVELSLDPFNYEEAAAARAVIEEYYRAGNEKDRTAQLATLTQRYHAPNVRLPSDDKSVVAIRNILYSPSDSRRDAQNYVKYGRGSVNGVKPENVIVFYIDLDVSFPKGTSEQEKGAWLQTYDNWNMILIRDSKDGKWLIDDMGY